MSSRLENQDPFNDISIKKKINSRTHTYSLTKRTRR